VRSDLSLDKIDSSVPGGHSVVTTRPSHKAERWIRAKPPGVAFRVGLHTHFIVVRVSGNRCEVGKRFGMPLRNVVPVELATGRATPHEGRNREWLYPTSRRTKDPVGSALSGIRW